MQQVWMSEHHHRKTLFFGTISSLRSRTLEGESAKIARERKDRGHPARMVYAPCAKNSARSLRKNTVQPCLFGGRVNPP